MKFLFLLVCITAAVAFSLLGIIYGTGWIPVKEEYEPPVRAEKVDPEEEVTESDLKGYLQVGKIKNAILRFSS